MTAFLAQQHIRTAAQFQRVYALRQRLNGRCYVLYHATNDAHLPRLGVVASKRSIRKAVDRNRAKRVAREAFRGYQSRIGNIDIVIIAKAPAGLVSKQELRLCVNKLFSQLSAFPAMRRSG